MASTILAVGLFVFAAYLFKGIFNRTGIPDVLLLMLCGIVMGPVMGWADAAAFGKAGSVMATMGLVIILFESGVDLDLASLRPSMAATLKISLSTFVASAMVVTAIAYAFAGLDLSASLMLAIILAGTSSAVVIPLVQSLGVAGRARTVLILESAITDVLCIVGLFTMIDASTKGGFSVSGVAGSVLATLLAAALIGGLAGFVWLFVLRAARRLPHGTFASAAMCFIVYGLTELAGFSGAICALCFGLVLANGRQFAKALPLIRAARLATFSKEEQGFLHELIFVLKTFFFVFLGISMKLSDARLFLIGGSITLLIFAARHVLTAYLFDRDLPRHYASLTAIMVPKGLAAAVLAGLPKEAGVPGGEMIQSVAYVVVLLSIALTAILIPLQRVNPVKGQYDKWFARFAPEAANDAAAAQGVDHPAK